MWPFTSPVYSGNPNAEVDITDTIFSSVPTIVMMMHTNKLGGIVLVVIKFGVVLKIEPLLSLYSFLYHHFVVELSKLIDDITVSCLKFFQNLSPLPKE